MFKKTLAAAAVLGAFAGSAFAADVTLYGVVDYGFGYQYTDADQAKVDNQNNFQLKAGQNSGSRFGLKGTEELGNGLKVSFVLENGFAADTGAFFTSGTLFDRQASLAVSGQFGEVAFGRLGQLASSLGSYGLLGATSPFSTGWGDISGVKYVQAAGHTRYNNMVTYKTPTFAGFTVFAQYSFGDSGKKMQEGNSTVVEHEWAEGKASANRYYGLGATYKTQNLYLVGVVDSVNYGSEQTPASSKTLDDSLTVTLGGNYNFGVLTAYGAFQYFDNAISVGQKYVTATAKIDTAPKVFTNGAEGWSVGLGVDVPVCGGTAKFAAGYVDAEDTKVSENDLQRWNVTAGYAYNLSKRTSVYTAATYLQDSFGTKGQADRDPSAVEVMAGLVHKF